MPPEDTEQARWFSSHLLPHEPLLRAWLEDRYPEANNIDDIIQDAYLRVLNVRHSRTLRSPKAFLFKTARNLALDHLRSHSVSRTIPLVDDHLSNVIDGSETAPEAVARKQELLIMRKAIESLPERCRQIVTLHKVYGIPQKEVAKRMGISVNTLSTQLAIGLAKCTAYVERYRKEGLD